MGISPGGEGKLEEDELESGVWAEGRDDEDRMAVEEDGVGAARSRRDAVGGASSSIAIEGVGRVDRELRGDEMLRWSVRVKGRAN